MGRAIEIERVGGVEVMQLRERDPGAPGEGAIRVAVEAAGVNYIDTYHRTGLYPVALPYVLGLEGAGVVEAVGAGVSELAVGDRVAWSSAPGSYATHVVLPAARAVRVPKGVSGEQAAAAMLQGMTAHYLVNGVRETKPGETALVHAAAGGTGLLLTQMLKRAGARVIGTCGSEDKAALARGAGADEVILYREHDFAAAVLACTAKRGVDVVFDGVGKATFDGSLASLRPRGMLVLFGQSSGPVPPFDPARLAAGGSLFLTRPSLFHYTATRGELELRANAVLSAIAQGELSLHIGARYPLAQAAEAHAALEGRRTTGKVLLVP